MWQQGGAIPRSARENLTGIRPSGLREAGAADHSSDSHCFLLLSLEEETPRLRVALTHLHL